MTVINLPADSRLPRPLPPIAHEHGEHAAVPMSDQPVIAQRDARSSEEATSKVAGDSAIRRLTTAAVLLVAGIAAIVSFLHIRELALTYGQGELAAFLTPLSIDGTVVVASLAMLRAARAGIDTPGLARFMLVLAVAATLAANIGYGIPFGLPGALISGWPAVAFIGSVEIAVGMVRRLSRSGDGDPTDHTEATDHSVPAQVITDQPRDTGVPPAPVSAQSTPLTERPGGESAPTPALTPTTSKRTRTRRRAKRQSTSRNTFPIVAELVDRAGGVDLISVEEIHAQTGIAASTIRRHRATIRRTQEAVTTDVH